MSSEAPTIIADSALGRRAVQLLNDPKDYAFLSLMAQCGLVAGIGIGLFFAGDFFWYALPVYYLLLFAWVLDRFILMLHCTSHRALFKPRYSALNQIIPWFLGPFCGQTPESYFAHHMGMHHREGNMPSDLSSTMRYQRERFTHWLRYLGSFLTVGLPELVLYHRRGGKKKLLRRLLVGELGYWLFAASMLWLNTVPALFVLVLPVLLVRTLMMAGNWGQHAFVCPDEPDNAYRNSITCIGTRYNRRCFNDGYHIHHHVRPRCHWSEYPEEFEQNKAEYGRQDAIVFDGIDFFQVWLLLMTKRWRTLASHFVQLPGAPVRDEAQVLALFRRRLAAFEKVPADNAVLASGAAQPNPVA